jgi:hypothetical protein
MVDIIPFYFSSSDIHGIKYKTTISIIFWKFTVNKFDKNPVPA